jgi:SAM-dependent methyltransferase
MGFRNAQATRGTGYLEKTLAQLRAIQANKLIPTDHRLGRILDIGCGSFPYFLSHTKFKNKFAIDKQKPNSSSSDIQWICLDLNHADQMPLESSYFDVVTMLALIEHLNPENLVKLFLEVNRILVPGGVLIVTTPASWSNGLLKFLASINFVSKEEIDEHVYNYTLPLLGWYFGSAGFSMTKLKFGYFELGLNLWGMAIK